MAGWNYAAAAVARDDWRDRKSWPRFSAGHANENGCMGDVARVHADILRNQEKK
jgi:hypothetical protein